MSDNSQISNGQAHEPQVYDEQGRLIENVIRGRTYATEAWCRAAVAAAGVGNHVIVGTLAGVAVSFEKLESEYGPYVKLKGQFRATSALTGEISDSPWAILPGKAAGAMAEVAFTGDGDHPAALRLMLDCEISVVGTEKGFPYRWGVRSFDIERTETQRVVDAIAARQAARDHKRIEAPAKPDAA